MHIKSRQSRRDCAPAIFIATMMIGMTSGPALASDGVLEIDQTCATMLELLTARQSKLGVRNVEPVLGTAEDPNLPAGAVNLIFIVDAYHEFSYPREMGEAMVRALAPGGRLVLVEYRAEDASVPIKRLHKMSAAQAEREMCALGLELEENGDYLPQQHVLVFRRPAGA